MGNVNGTAKAKPMVFPNFVYSVMFPGPPPQSEQLRIFPSLRMSETTFHPSLYFVPCGKVIATTGPQKGKPFSCPVVVKVANQENKNNVEPRPFVVVYFHGNAESLEDSIHLVECLNVYLNCTIVAVEFPGYGVTNGAFSYTKPEDIDAWTESVYIWITDTLGVPGNLIIPFGRSIGTGPAAHMAEIMNTKYNVGCPGLVLNAPYRSINVLGKMIAGSIGGAIAGNPWDTEEAIENLNTAVTKLLILHGQQDEIIPYSHGRHLFDSYRGQVSAHFPENRGHNDFGIEDYLLPFHEFFRKYFDGHKDYHRNMTAFINEVETNLAKSRRTHEVPQEYITLSVPDICTAASRPERSRMLCGKSKGSWVEDEGAKRDGTKRNPFRKACTDASE